MNPLKTIWSKIGMESLSLGLGYLLTAVGGLFSIRLLTSYYRPDAYGLSWLFINGVGLAVMFTAGPVGQAAVRFYHESKNLDCLDELLGLLWMAEIYITTTAVIIYVTAGLSFGWFAGNHGLAFGLMPLFFLFQSFVTITQALLNTSRKRLSRTILSVIEAWSKPLCAVLLYFIWRADVNSFVLGYAIGSLITGALSMKLFSGYGSTRPMKLPLPSKPYTIDVIRYTAPWIPLIGSLWLLSLSDRYIVNHYLGHVATGTYIAAYQVGSAIFQLLGSFFSLMIQPILLEHSSKNKSNISMMITNSFRAFAWLSIPVLFAFILMHKWLMMLLVDKQYWDGAAASLWVGLGVYMYSFGLIAMQVFMITKNTSGMVSIHAISALSNIILNVIFVPRFGIVGAGAATFISYAIYAVMLTIYSKYHMSEWRFPFNTYIFLLYISLASSIIAKFFHYYLLNNSYDFNSSFIIFITYIAALGLLTLIFRNFARRDLSALLHS